MSDKSTLQISDELTQFIEALVNEVVHDGKLHENRKKYLRLFCQAEGVDEKVLENNLSEFFEIMEEWKLFHTRGSSMMAKMLSGKCYLSEAFVENLLATTVGEALLDNEQQETQTEIGQDLMAVEDNQSHDDEKKKSKAQNDFKDLMAGLVPDLINKKEKLDYHFYYVKKMAHESGWKDDEIVSALADFLSMYDDFQKEHSSGEPFSNSEKRLLSYQASFAHIDQSLLDKIL